MRPECVLRILACWLQVAMRPECVSTSLVGYRSGSNETYI
jgi:hypothetical protein